MGGCSGDSLILRTHVYFEFSLVQGHHWKAHPAPRPDLHQWRRDLDPLLQSHLPEWLHHHFGSEVYWLDFVVETVGLQQRTCSSCRGRSLFLYTCGPKSPNWLVFKSQVLKWCCMETILDIRLSYSMIELEVILRKKYWRRERQAIHLKRRKMYVEFLQE